MSAIHARIPITLFASTFEPFAEMAEDNTWTEFVQFLRETASQPLDRKEDRWLFASGSFMGGRRKRTSGIRTGMVVLDVDGRCRIPEAVRIIRRRRIERLVYTTASHGPAIHKFRICIPLAVQIEPTQLPLVWASVNTLFGTIADRTKRQIESLFYLPGMYRGVANRFFHFRGQILSADEWTRLIPVATPAPDPKAAPVTGTNGSQRRRSKPGNRRTRSDEITWSPIQRCSFVTERAMDRYLSLSAGQHHHGRFAFLLSVARVASLKGHRISAADLVAVFNELDALDSGGPWYGSSKDQAALLRDAEHALAEATTAQSRS